MNALLDNPLFFAFPLSTLVLVGGWFLLRWAGGAAHKDPLGQAAMGLSLMFLSAYLFGKPGWPLGFGAQALLGALSALTIMSLFNGLWFKSVFLEALLLLGAIWILLGLPLEADLMVAIMGSWMVMAATVFVLLGFYHPKAEGLWPQDGFVITLVLSLSAHFYALLVQDFNLIAYSGVLFFLILVCFILTHWRFEGAVGLNMVSPIYLSLGYLFWALWFYAQVPLMSLICLMLVPGARSVAAPVLEKYEGERHHFIYALALFFMSLLPVGVSFAFFFVFK